MLAAEGRAAERGRFFRPPRRAVIARLVEADGDWAGPGDVGLDGRRLVFEARTERRRTSLRTVEAVERRDAVLWVRRRRAHDWLVRCRSVPEAEGLEARIVEALAGRAP